MNKLYLLDIITQVSEKRACWKGVIRKVNIKFFLNPLNSNTTNIIKDSFIISTEDMHKKITTSHEKVLTLQKII